MKKIVFLHNVLDVGGAENLRLAILKNIDRKRYNIKVCCIGNKGVIGEKIEKLGFRVDELKYNPTSRNLFVTYHVFKYLRKEKPNILHSCLFNANFHGRIAGLFSRVPSLIVEEHGEYKEYKGIKYLPFIVADFLLSRITNFIICCSEELKKDIGIKEGLPQNRLVSIGNRLDTDMYKVTTEREIIRKKYNISDELVFIVVASLKARKGHDSLMEALGDVKKAGYNFKCFFAGDGPLRGTLQKRCHELGLSDEIIFLGHVDKVADYLNASDVFVLPSLSEGLSMALMEAMHMGLASIVTDVGENKNLISDHVNGIVVSAGSKDKLKEAIVFYFKNKDLISRFGVSSKEAVKERCDINKYVKEFYAVWDRCE